MASQVADMLPRAQAANSSSPESSVLSHPLESLPDVTHLGISSEVCAPGVLCQPLFRLLYRFHVIVCPVDWCWQRVCEAYIL